MIDTPSVPLIYLTSFGYSIAFFSLVYTLRNKLSSLFANWLNRHDRIDLILVGIASGALVLMVLSAIGVNAIFTVVAGILTIILVPKLLASHLREKFVLAFDSSLVESLTTVSSSLKAGLTLRAALEVAEKNCPEVFAKEIRQALKEYRFGKPLEKCLNGVRVRVDTDNANIAFGAMIVGHQLGGNLPNILQRIVHTIRERERVSGKLKALTAQGRTQAILLCSAPPCIGVAMYLWDPARMSLLTNTLHGQILLSIAIAFEVIGIFVMRNMMKLSI